MVPSLRDAAACTGCGELMGPVWGACMCNQLIECGVGGIIRGTLPRITFNSARPVSPWLADSHRKLCSGMPCLGGFMGPTLGYEPCIVGQTNRTECQAKALRSSTAGCIDGPVWLCLCMPSLAPMAAPRMHIVCCRQLRQWQFGSSQSDMQDGLAEWQASPDSSSNLRCRPIHANSDMRICFNDFGLMKPGAAH